MCPHPWYPLLFFFPRLNLFFLIPISSPFDSAKPISYYLSSPSPAALHLLLPGTLPFCCCSRNGLFAKLQCRCDWNMETRRDGDRRLHCGGTFVVYIWKCFMIYAVRLIVFASRVCCRRVGAELRYAYLWKAWVSACCDDSPQLHPEAGMVG
jgi:hypothetical protein